MTSIKDDIDSYIVFIQANTWKSHHATNELGQHIDVMMQNYKYDGPECADLIINRKVQKDENYVNRMAKIGIKLDESGKIISRPSQAEAKKYKASYRKSLEKGKNLKKDTPPTGGTQNGTNIEIFQRCDSCYVLNVCGVQSKIFQCFNRSLVS